MTPLTLDERLKQAENFLADLRAKIPALEREVAAIRAEMESGRTADMPDAEAQMRMG